MGERAAPGMEGPSQKGRGTAAAAVDRFPALSVSLSSRSSEMPPDRECQI